MASFEEINIPQKPPMVMVDRVVELMGSGTVAAFHIRENNVFVENGFFREPGLIENMAQTAAAGAGARPGAENKPPAPGYIGGIRNLKIFELPRTGDEIFTHITVLHEIFDATVVSGQVFLKDKLIAECELKIFLIK
ncbi:MAG: hydroxymyristoyl-ACP dehydratase [Bacteroidales bacterium]|nr:hydroxymyristoyl-ACP dehydratase [Bacteroidales bacterium]